MLKKISFFFMNEIDNGNYLFFATMLYMANTKYVILKKFLQYNFHDMMGAFICRILTRLCNISNSLVLDNKLNQEIEVTEVVITTSGT